MVFLYEEIMTFYSRFNISKQKNKDLLCLLIYIFDVIFYV